MFPSKMTSKDWLKIGPNLWKKSEKGILSFVQIIQSDINNWIVNIKLPDVPGNPYGRFFNNKLGAFRYAQNYMKKN